MTGPKSVAADSRRLAATAARAALSKQAERITVIDVRELITITDYFVICSGSSARQVATIADEVVRELKERGGVRPVRREGETGAGWQLIDFVDLVVHVFDEEARDFYRLETLWADAPVVDWEREPAAS